MAYIGQQPVVGRYIKIDQISGGFNGTASGFTLAAGGQGVLPGTARNLMLSLGGVIQEPETDFTVSGSGLTFTTPPVSGTTFFAVVFGDMQAVGTPSDNTVTPATISPTGTFVFPNVTVSGTTVIASGTAAVPSLSVTGDSNTGLFSPGSDQLSITAGGTERVKLGTTEVVFNDSGNDVDFRVEGDTNANLLFIDASTDRVGLGTSSPANGRLNVSAATNQITVDTGDTATYGRLDIGHFTNGTFIGTYAGSNTASDLIRFGTGGTTRMTLDSSGRLGIGTTSPNASLVVAASGAAGFEVTPGSVSASSGTLIEHYNRSTAAYVQVRTIASVHRFDIGSTEAGRFDSSGRFLVGTSTARTNFDNGGVSARLQVEGLNAGNCYISAVGVGSNNYDAGGLVLARSAGTTVGGNSLVANGDFVGLIRFMGNDGSEFVEAARIDAFVDGTPGANDMPGRLVFSTTADGASSPTERMRITSTGDISTKTTPSSFSAVGLTIYGATGVGPNAVDVTRSGGYVLAINRTTNDGNLIEFYQDTVLEGTISVSGTTVSYNGAHLSRYSQLPGGVERTEILRGTVLSNIDEMCGWGEEENEQLNRMKVSDVEGDPNVAGVFQAWDDDDDTYTDDFYCAMTGDFIIRIAEGVTVQRGDLLMSAGDGTAKPQDDDIIRSKTIAKVTSTHVTCTYDDGSYCVPCVLMAC